MVTGPLDKIVDGLKTRLIIKAKVERFSAAEKEKMIEKFKLESIDIKENTEKKEFELEICAKAPEKLKKELAKYLADDEIGLLEFAEVKMALEDLFKQMIH